VTSIKGGQMTLISIPKSAQVGCTGLFGAAKLLNVRLRRFEKQGSASERLHKWFINKNTAFIRYLGMVINLTLLVS
jgi:hypothetical protein